MKKLLFTFFLFSSCLWASAQDATSVFSYFKDKKHVEYVSAPRMVMNLVASKMKTGNFQALLSQIYSAKLLTLSQCRRGIRKKFTKKIVELGKTGYDEIAAFKENDDNISIVARKGSDNMIKEAVVMISGKTDCIGILVTGNINPEDVAAAIGTAE